VFDDEAALLSTSLYRGARPLLKATYALGAWAHGPSPMGFRLVNVALHAMTAVLVFILAERWLSARRIAETGGVRIAAFAGAMLWAMHPLAAETVTYVSGRSMGLSTLLVLAAVFLATSHEIPSRRGAVGAGVLAFLAPLAKETALILPLLLAWWEVTLGPRDVTWWERFRRHAPVWAGTLAAALVLFALPRHRELVGFSLAVRPPLEALRGNVQAVPAIIGLWAFPWRISIDPAAPLEWGWTEGPTLVRLAGLGALAALVFALRRRVPWFAFAAGWMLLAIAPGNSIVWRLDPVAVRPLYLASVGPAILAAFLVSAAWERSAARNLVLAWTAALALGLGFGLGARNALHRSPVALWEDAVLKAPRNARAKTNLGFAYLAADRLDDAEAALRAARDAGLLMRQAECGLLAIHIRRETMALEETR
jgi:hypothetical protein